MHFIARYPAFVEFSGRGREWALFSILVLNGHDSVTRGRFLLPPFCVPGMFISSKVQVLNERGSKNR